MILVELYLVVAIMIFAIMMMFLLYVRKELKWWMLLLATIACGIASFLWILCFIIFVIAMLYTELMEYINKD